MIPFLKARPHYAALLFAAILSSAGCATLQPRDFAQSKTHFDLERYFTGHTRSWGVFENRDGAPRRWFIADSVGTRQTDGSLVLAQRFHFSDGKKQTRTWRIWRVDATHWEATANDVIGITRGEAQGNVLFWQYTITTDAKNPLATVHVRQWIYQAEGTDTVMTRLVITKMGVPLFEVTESIHHVAD